MSGWVIGIGSAVGGIATAVGANQAAKAVGSTPAPQPIDLSQLGLSSLNAQANIAPTQLQLENQYRPQYGNVGNNALQSGLFGQTGLQQNNQQDPNFAALPPEIQQILAANPQLAGQIAGKSGYDQISAIYQAAGNKLGTPDQNNAFNDWSTKNFGNWGGEGPAPGLQSLQSWEGSTSPGGALAPAPGLVSILNQTNQALNPGLMSGLDKLNTAAGVAPATVTAPGVTQSKYAGDMTSLLGGAVPQVQGAGANAGMDALSGLLGGQGGYQPITASKVAQPGAANLAGPVATAATPQIGSASQASFTGSAAPVSVQAPGQVGQVTGSSVAAPTSYEKVNAPSAVGNIASPGPIDNIMIQSPVGNVTAQTGYQQVQAPGSVANVQAPGAVQNVSAPGAIQVGKNSVLDSLSGLGFSANRPIQQTLEHQAQSDLALGNQMNPDQIRAAQQASRAASNARGMVGGNGAILDEMQRQFNVSNQLQNDRRTFAANTENQGFNQLATQQGQAANVAGLQNQYLGLDVNAQQSNAANQLSAAQGNQQAGIATNAQGLQAGVANQNAALTTNAQGLDAQRANQAAGLAGNQLNLQGQIANQQTGLANNAQNLTAQQANQTNQQFLANLGFQTGAQNQQTGLANNAQQLQTGIANQNAGQANAALTMQGQIANQANAYNVGATNQQAALTQGNQALQAGIANQNTAAQNSQFNAGQANALSQYNTGQQNTQQLALAQLMSQLGMYNAGQQNQSAQFNATQQDVAANRDLQAGTTNAQLNQQTNLANQAGALQGFGQNSQIAQTLAQLGLTQTGLNQSAQQANQGAFLQNQGQQIGALNSLMGSDNQLNQFNAQQNLGAQQFNAGQQQQGFNNLMSAQGANQAAAISPLAAAQLNNQNAQPQLFNPFDPAIMSIFAGNQQNAANYGIAQGNNNAAINAGMINGLSNFFGGAINAYGQYAGG